MLLPIRIAIGGAVGTGLIIGSGQGLPKAGPVGMLLGYSIMGLVCFGVSRSLSSLPARKIGLLAWRDLAG